MGTGTQAADLILQEAAQHLYQTSNRTFTPCYPFVLVYVLQKEQLYAGSVVLPESGQNKPVHEGIVVATWKPFTREASSKLSAHKAHCKHCDMDIMERPLGACPRCGKRIARMPESLTRTVRKESQFEIGDHVLFPHWSGAPLMGLNEKHWRVIKEENWDVANEGGVFAKIDYSDVHTKAATLLREQLAEMLDSSDLDLDNDRLAGLIAAKLEERFLLVDRAAQSVTLSGE